MSEGDIQLVGSHRIDQVDEVGQDGVEYTYDHFLRGKPGITRTQVDAFGQPTRNGRLVSQPPVPGDNLKLTAPALWYFARLEAPEELGIVDRVVATNAEAVRDADLVIVVGSDGPDRRVRMLLW